MQKRGLLHIPYSNPFFYRLTASSYIMPGITEHPIGAIRETPKR